MREREGKKIARKFKIFVFIFFGGIIFEVLALREVLFVRAPLLSYTSELFFGHCFITILLFYLFVNLITALLLLVGSVILPNLENYILMVVTSQLYQIPYKNLVSIL